MTNYVAFAIIGIIAGFPCYNIMLNAYTDGFIVKPLNCNDLKQWVLDDKISWEYAKARYDLQCVEHKQQNYTNVPQKESTK